MTIGVRFTARKMNKKKRENDIAKGMSFVDVYDDEGDTVMLATILQWLKN